MLSIHHETLVQAFRDRPQLAVELLGALDVGVALGDAAGGSVQQLPGDLTEPIPAELRADLVVLLSGPSRLGVIVEVQLQRPTRRKRAAWVSYLAAVHARYQCPALLLIVTPIRAVAKAARRPIQLGPGASVQAQVIGPDDLLTLNASAALEGAPQVALLAILAARSLPTEQAIEVARRAELTFVRHLPPTQAELYFDLGRAVMKPDLRLQMEELMASEGAYNYQSEFARKYVAEGEAKGEARGREEGREEGREVALISLTALLKYRFGPLPAEVLQRLDASDLTTLRRWASAVEHAPSLDALLDA